MFIYCLIVFNYHSLVNKDYQNSNLKLEKKKKTMGLKESVE